MIEETKALVPLAVGILEINGAVNISTGMDDNLSSNTERLSCGRSVQNNQKKKCSFSRKVMAFSLHDLPISETSDFEHGNRVFFL